jgi:hypothetical protein
MKVTESFAILALIAPVSDFADRGAPDDHQCAKCLICVDQHKQQLKAAGFDTRTADCGPGSRCNTPTI